MISNCGTFPLTSLKEVIYNEYDASDVKNVITKTNPRYMILLTVDVMYQVFLAIFANYTSPSFLQLSIKGMFLFYHPTLLINRRNYQPMFHLPAITCLPPPFASYN